MGTLRYNMKSEAKWVQISISMPVLVNPEDEKSNTRNKHKAIIDSDALIKFKFFITI